MSTTLLPKRILVADNEPETLVLMRAALKKYGFEVSAVADGEQALQQFRSNPCDMVILNVDMPRLNGFQVLTALRKEARRDLPIILVIGMDDMVSIEKAYDCGATDFIAKPISWQLIGCRVKYLFRTYQNMTDLSVVNARNQENLAAAIPDTVFRMDNAGLILDSYNERMRFSGVFALSAGSHLLDSLPEEIALNLMNAMKLARDSNTVQIVTYSLEGRYSDIGHYEARVVVIDQDETLCLVSDVTVRKESENKFFNLAYFDTLTGLPNYRSFLDRLDREIRRAKMQGGKLAVLSIGLDRFTIINESMGYPTGDNLLQLAADRLRERFCTNDVISRTKIIQNESALARPGGDEFSVLIHINQPEEALGVAEQICEIMGRPFVIDEYHVLLTVSNGIALYPENGDNAEVLLKEANTAMHHAKKDGHDNNQFYNISFTQQAQRRLILENNLRVALERDEFYLLYQPKFNLRKRCIQSVEALIRWKNPEKGIISPVDFIPIAEETGLIIPIGEWVLRHACHDAIKWRRAGLNLNVAVNLSAKQFRDANLLETVLSALSSSSLTPDFVELEITENALMEDNESTLKILRNLRKNGIHIALDDFGTGYSSMSYLKHIPLNTLKIDQSFVKELPHNKENFAIVLAIISMAKSLGYAVVAEGVETLEQVQILKQLNCDVLQGYFFSKPVDASEIITLSRKQWDIY
jgi:diguanylate cyclase (GGDEF)-like protein